MTVIYEDLDLPDSSAPWPAEVRVRLAGAQGRPILGKTVSTGKAIVGETLLSTGNGISNAGIWQMDLVPNSDILPAGTTWRIERNIRSCDSHISFITVPVTGGPFEAFTREDDPLGSITPSALAAHASLLDLHGGGIEVDFASLTSPLTVTGSGGGAVPAVVAGLTITVPDLARPIYLFGHVPVIQPTGGPTSASWGIYPQAFTSIFDLLDEQQETGLGTTNHRMVDPFARLAAHSPGDYVIAATGLSGNLTARTPASALNIASLRAVAA